MIVNDATPRTPSPPRRSVTPRLSSSSTSNNLLQQPHQLHSRSVTPVTPNADSRPTTPLRQTPSPVPAQQQQPEAKSPLLTLPTTPIFEESSLKRKTPTPSGIAPPKAVPRHLKGPSTSSSALPKERSASPPVNNNNDNNNDILVDATFPIISPPASYASLPKSSSFTSKIPAPRLPTPSPPAKVTTTTTADNAESTSENATKPASAVSSRIPVLAANAE